MTPAEVKAFFEAHWTVRKYRPFTMPSDHLDVILYAAQRAPTDATAQMYSLVRLVDPALRADIAKLAANAHMATASECFIVCADLHRLSEILKARGHAPGHFPQSGLHFAIGDAVMAGQNMLVASEMLGYRGCWIGGVLNALEEIAARLELPAQVCPFAGLTIGVPDEASVHRPRLPREMVVHENHYRAPQNLQSAVDAMAPLSARGDWAQSLSRYFAEGGTMIQREADLVTSLKKRWSGVV